jgi:hypothetical protein
MCGAIVSGPIDPSSSIEPSAGPLATSWCAMLPPAPALLSTTHRLADVVAQLPGDQARSRIGRAAGREADDQRDDLLRREVLGETAAGAGEHGQSQHGGAQQQALVHVCLLG